MRKIKNINGVCDSYSLDRRTFNKALNRGIKIKKHALAVTTSCTITEIVGKFTGQVSDIQDQFYKRDKSVEELAEFYIAVYLNFIIFAPKNTLYVLDNISMFDKKVLKCKNKIPE
ncbi:MAG: hypothetical protein ACQXXG_09855 [Candidatus Bathyarchaeia archaeon]|jgi:hypothetical protein